MTDPIRAALERLIEALDDYEPVWGGFPESALAAARAALAEQQGEGPSDKELNILWNCSGIADEHGNHTGNIFEFARAVLARWGHQPAPPAEGEVAKPQKASTAELTANIQIDTSPECLQRLFDGLNAAVKPDGGYRAQTTDDPMVQTGCEQMVGVEWWLPQHGCDSLENTLDAIKGRILTAVFKWWPTATVSATQPPAEGEVAELAEFLRIYGDEVMDEYGDVGEHDQLTRAADLLERQATVCAICERERLHQSTRAADLEVERQAAPVPVPVSERLPGPGEMDGSLVWCGSQAAGLPYWEWCLDDIRHPGSSGYTHWLPANTPALPTPCPYPRGRWRDELAANRHRTEGRDRDPGQRL